jgi:TRAP-type mannitol/chloroaromatic compound transport system substrate-binding protein
VNEDAWNELPQNLQNVVVQAARATTAYMSSYYEYGNIEATKKFQNAGVEITHLSKESMTRLNTVIEEVLAEEAQKNPDFKMVLQSQIDFMKDFAPVREYESPYTFGTNELPIPDIQ